MSSNGNKATVESMLASYPREAEHLMPALQQVQDALGYLPEDAIEALARHFRTSPSYVYGVVTFYPQLRLTPAGRNLIKVCRGTACHVKGGPRIRQEVEKQLGIKEGETTEDMEFTLETVACIRACAIAPTMLINKETYGQLTAKKVAEVLDQYRARRLAGEPA